MKTKSVLQWRAQCCVFILTALFTAQAWSDCSLTSTWEPWEPYQYQDGENITGLDNDLVKAIFKQANCQINFVKRPWARALKEIEAGSIDLASGASMNDERKQYAHFSIPYRDETMVLMVRKGEASKYDLRKITDIAGIQFELGVVRDFYYGDDHKAGLEDPTYNKKVSEVQDDTANLKKLAAKRTDGILIDKYVGPYLAKQMGIYDQFEVHPVPINSDNIYLMFSQKTVTPVFVDSINTAIDTLKDNGELDTILQRYLK